MPIQVPATVLPIRLHAHASGNAAEVDPTAWAPVIHVGDKDEFPGFNPAYLGFCRSEPEDGRALSVTKRMLVCLSE